MAIKRKINNNKKGMFFTIMTIIFLSVFLFYFSVYSYKKSSEKMDVVGIRVKSIENFIKSTERDIQRGLYIASFRALLSLEEYMTISNGTFVDNVTQRFKELVINGTMNNTENILMQESTLPDWINSVESKASKINVIMNITFDDIQVYHEDPWHVTIGANFTIYANDSSGIAWWEKKEYLKSAVSVVGFEDPLYIVNGYGRITNLINQTAFEGNYVSGDNVTNLMTHLEGMYYTNNEHAPSFLMRFENNLGASPYGIESLVNLQKLTEQGLAVYDRSCVDYIYFGGIPTTNYRINNTPSWFKLDNGSLSKYEVTGLTYP